MISSKTKIGLLVSIHVVAGLLLAWANYNLTDINVVDERVFIGLCALVFAEAGLLGIWGGLGTTRPLQRLPAVSIATAYLCCVLVFATIRKGNGGGDMVSLITASPTVVVLLVLSRLRHGPRRLRLAHSIAWPTTLDGFQFTIRHIFLTTAVVAVLLAICRGLRTLTVVDFLFEALFIPCLISVELATLWAALGIGRPMLRLALVVPTAFIIGIMPIYCLGAPGWFNFIIWPIIMGLQAIFTAASLLVVRSCGWRLVRGTGEQQEDLPTPPGS